MIKVLNEELVKKLARIADDNVSIGGIVIDRKKLLAALKLQKTDMLAITYGKVSWHDRIKNPYNDSWHDYEITDEPCISISCERTFMRFLNRPNAKHGELKVTPLNFVDHREYVKPEVAGIPLDTRELLGALQYALTAVAKEDSRLVLHCVLFDSSNDTIKLISADGFRLAIAPIQAKGIPEDKVLIQLKDAIKIVSFLKGIKAEGRGKSKYYPEVFVTYGEKITFACGNDSLELEKLNDTYHFPDYSQLIPKDGTKCEFIASEVLQAVKSLLPTVKDGSQIIQLQFARGIIGDEDKLTLSGKSEELSESSVECSAKVDWDCKIAANALYLVDFLKQCGDTRISVKITSPSSPMLFESGAFTHVLMPMFVQWDSPKPEPEPEPEEVIMPEDDLSEEVVDETRELVEVS